MSEVHAASIVPRAEPSSPRAADEATILHRRLRRLALDVHDGPMQSLIAAGYGLHDLQTRGGANDAAVSDRLSDIAAELVDVERGLRSLILSLEQGAETEREPLDAIVATEVARFRRTCAITVEVRVAPGGLADSHSQEIAIRSIVKEALSNVAKHSRATRVEIFLEADAKGIHLEISDDGCGFDPAAVPMGRIGLTSMRERLQFLAGTVGIDSCPGGPTRIVATLPRWRSAEQ